MRFRFEDAEKRIEFLSMTLLPKKVKVIEETIDKRGIKK